MLLGGFPFRQRALRPHHLHVHIRRRPAPKALTASHDGGVLEAHAQLPGEVLSVIKTACSACFGFSQRLLQGIALAGVLAVDVLPPRTM